MWLDIHDHGGIFLNNGPEQGITGYPGKTRPEILEQFPDYILPDEVTDEGWWKPEWGKEDWPASHARAVPVGDRLQLVAVASAAHW